MDLKCFLAWSFAEHSSGSQLGSTAVKMDSKGELRSKPKKVSKHPQKRINPLLQHHSLLYHCNPYAQYVTRNSSFAHNVPFPSEFLRDEVVIAAVCCAENAWNMLNILIVSPQQIMLQDWFDKYLWTLG